MSILIFLVILLVLVLAHEWGHFFTAKKFGIRVDEFGFGFPPKLFGKKIGETEYTFNLLPLGGFVKIFGESPDEESISGPDKDRSFVNKPKWQQAIVLFAGIFMNFIVAWVLLSVGFMSGLPMSASVESDQVVKNPQLTVVSVLPESPAQIAGLKSGDKILSIRRGEAVLENPNPETFRAFISSQVAPVDVSYRRGKAEPTTLSVTPRLDTNQDKPLIGISMDMIGIAKLPPHEALWEGLKLNWYITEGTVLGIVGLITDSFKGQGSLEAVTGPVGMVGIVGDAYEFGFVYLLSFAALISINLAIINLVPFPALDGGRLFFLLIEAIKGSRLNPKVANTANIIGFALLILLMLFVTYHDIAKLF